MKWIEKHLTRLKEENLYRKRVLREDLIDLCSNDYLGLRTHQEVISASVRAVEEEGLGSGASQLVSGWGKYHRELERTLSTLKGTPSCLLFGSGYLANIGSIPALVGEGDMILSDKANHASLIDACRLSRAEVFVFRHRDYDHLRDILSRERHRFRRALIITDSVFSMEGDIADIPSLLSLSREFETMLYIDDAHGTGTLGSGRGVMEYFGLEWEENVIIMGTLSKAIGAYGAFVCGSEELIDYLINTARSLIFTTSLPPAVCAGAKRAVELILENPGWSERLRKRAKYMKGRLEEIGLSVAYHGTPIIPLMVGDEERAIRLSQELLARGILLRAIRYPAVPRGSARLRLTASLSYREEELDKFYTALEELISGK